MRHTELPEETNVYFGFFQEMLDAFWSLIEDKYEDEWRMEYSGAINLRVDDAMLERILNDNVETAWYAFGAFKGGQDKTGRRFFLSRPETLKGLYSITGIYNERQALVDGPREYFFEPEGN